MIISHKSPTAPKRINEERIQQIRGGFYYAPKDATFQTDDLSTDLVLGQVITLLAIRSLGLPDPTDLEWRDRDDVIHPFTADEFMQFFLALNVFVKGKMIESWQKKAVL